MPKYECSGCEHNCVAIVPKGMCPLVCLIDYEDRLGSDISDWEMSEEE